MSGLKKNTGFTLLEILVVVAIMGIILGVVGVNFNRNLDNVAHSEAKRYARVLNYTKEYSAYTGRILSLRLDKKDNTYYFLYVDPVRRNWNRLGKDSGSKLLSPHKINGLVQIKVEKLKADSANDKLTTVEEENSNRRSSTSEIALITPFSDFEPASLVLSGETKNYIVTTDEFDDVEIQIQ